MVICTETASFDLFGLSLPRGTEGSNPACSTAESVGDDFGGLEPQSRDSRFGSRLDPRIGSGSKCNAIGHWALPSPQKGCCVPYKIRTLAPRHRIVWAKKEHMCGNSDRVSCRVARYEQRDNGPAKQGGGLVPFWAKDISRLRQHQRQGRGHRLSSSLLLVCWRKGHDRNP